MKTCTKCNRNLELSNYSPDKRNRDGLQSHCNDCRRAYKQAERNKRKLGIGLISVKEKTCNKCNVTKAVTEFYRDMGLADGFGTLCKQCKDANQQNWKQKNRDQWNSYMAQYRKEHPLSVKDKEQKRNRGLKCRYGITSEQYDSLLLQQNNSCAICTKSPEKRKLVVDHSHLTQEARGLLCDGCNVAIAIFDNPELHEKALQYLKK